MVQLNHAQDHDKCHVNGETIIMVWSHSDHCYSHGHPKSSHTMVVEENFHTLDFGANTPASFMQPWKFTKWCARRAKDSIELFRA